MADPISLAAIAGLIFAGRSFSKKAESEPVQPEVDQTVEFIERPQNAYDEVSEMVERGFEPRMEVPQKREMESFGDLSYQQRSGGQEILNMRNRMYV